MPAAVQVHIPDYTYRLYDLSPYGAEEIKGRQKLRIFLELLAKTRWQDLEHFRSALEKIFVIFHELEQDDPEEALTYLETIIIYIMNVREDITLPDIIDQAAQISAEGRERMMTLAEKLFQEGMEKGLEKGLVEGMEKGMSEGLEKGLTEGMESERRKIVQNLLAAGFDAGKVAQAAELPLEEVMRLKKEMN